MAGGRGSDGPYAYSLFPVGFLINRKTQQRRGFVPEQVFGDLPIIPGRFALSGDPLLAFIPDCTKRTDHAARGHPLSL
jgi:hypothetical protein